MIRRLIAFAVLMLALASASQAATLYISEFPNAVSQVGSTSPQVYPQAALTDQTVALSGVSAISAAFNAKTHAVLLICDEGCSVNFGGTTATTSNYLLQQGVQYQFAVASGGKVAVIANAAGNGSGGGGGGGAVTMASGAVASGAYSSGSIASGAYASGSLAAGAGSDGWDVTQGTTTDAAATAGGTGTVSAKLRRLSTQLPAAVGQTTMAASLPVALASNQSSIPVTVASGGVASGAVASGAYASGSIAAGAIVDGADVTQGAKADAKSTATDTTPISVVSILKEISALEQAPASRAVTNAGTFAVQSTPATATSGGVTTTYVVEPAASDNHAVIKATAGQVYWMQAFNNSATVNYMRLYNATTGFNGCNSATNLVWEGHIPASVSDAGFSINFATPLAFGTGIAICVTGAYGQTSTTAATAAAISITVGYN